MRWGWMWMLLGMLAGVALMSLPSLSADSLRAGGTHWLSRRMPLEAGPSLGEIGWGIRGWTDDFFGDQLDDRYELRTEAALRSSLPYILGGQHGGVVYFLTGNVNGDYSRIMLGDSTYATNNLDPTRGFRIVTRMKLGSLTNILMDVFVCDINWNRIHIQGDTTMATNNWYLRTDDNSGIDNLVDSGVAFDMEWHWHVLEVRPGYAAHWIDGNLINSTTTKIPVVPMTANLRVLTRANAVKNGYVDFWEVIPQ